jgi:hypothetical protein
MGTGSGRRPILTQAVIAAYESGFGAVPCVKSRQYGALVGLATGFTTFLVGQAFGESFSEPAFRAGGVGRPVESDAHSTARSGRAGCCRSGGICIARDGVWGGRGLFTSTSRAAAAAIPKQPRSITHGE